MKDKIETLLAAILLLSAGFVFWSSVYYIVVDIIKFFPAFTGNFY